MIKPLYVLRETLGGFRIYVWGLNHSSLLIFSRLFFLGTKVNGFIVEENMPYIETVCNVPVVELQDLPAGQCVIFTSSRIKEILHAKYCDIDFKVLEECLCLNPELHEKTVYLYGAGGGARALKKELSSQGINVQSVFVTKKDINENVNEIDIPIHEYSDDSLQNDNEALIVSVIKPKVRDEILGYIGKCSADIYTRLDRGIEPEVDVNRIFAFSLHMALKSEKKIYLWKDSICHEYMSMLLKKYGIHNVETIDKNGIHELTEEKVKKAAFVLWEHEACVKSDIFQVALDIGFRLQEFQFIAPNPYAFYSRNMALKRNYYIRDILLGATVKYGELNCNGWNRLGDGTGMKVVIVGNSTSAYDVYSVETWGEKFFRKLSALCSATVFIGAREGETVVSECLRVLRDLHALKPDLVISMSGVTNMWNSLQGAGFNLNYGDSGEAGHSICKGCDADENQYDLWIRVEKMMKLYVESEGANFLPVLQPINNYMPKMNPDERMLFEIDELSEGAQCFYENATDDEIYLNLSSLFHHKNGLFIDYFHYSDKGNEILSDIVLEKVKENRWIKGNMD